MFENFREFGHEVFHDRTNYGWEVLESLGSQETVSRKTDHGLDPLLMPAQCRTSEHTTRGTGDDILKNVSDDDFRPVWPGQLSLALTGGHLPLQSGISSAIDSEISASTSGKTEARRMVNPIIGSQCLAYIGIYSAGL